MRWKRATYTYAQTRGGTHTEHPYRVVLFYALSMCVQHVDVCRSIRLRNCEKKEEKRAITEQVCIEILSTK